MSRYSLRFLQFGLMSALALLAGPVFALHANQSAELPLDRSGRHHQLLNLDVTD